MQKVYIAAAFRRHSERENKSKEAYGEIVSEKYIDLLEDIEQVFLEYGFDTCLPHRDEGQWGKRYYEPEAISSLCLRHVETSDMIFAIAEGGRGVHLEIGFAAHDEDKNIYLMYDEKEEPSTLIWGLSEDNYWDITESMCNARIDSYSSQRDLLDKLRQYLSHKYDKPKDNDTLKTRSKYGVIDIGSHTLKLKIISCHNGARPLTVSEESTSLGIMDDVLEHSRFKNDTIRNVVNTVKEWVRVCEQYNCDEVIATGTAALRQSSNTDSLTSSIKNELGINVEIISKSKEAGYVYSGVHSMFSEGIPLAVLNLGGGSTQISIGSENKPSHKILLDIGTKYITDKWAWEEPFDHSRYVNMLEHVTDKFQSEIPDGIGETGKLVHTGGELDFLLKCQVPMSVCNVSSSHVSKISRGRFEKFSRRFSELTPSKVANKFSLDPKWSAGSVASNVIAIAAMRTIGADELVPSNLNVADGVAISQFESD